MSSVSVVIPCYNYGHFLEEAVGSALTGQDGVDVRVLIIDDASPDDSVQQARRIAAADPRVEVRSGHPDRKRLSEIPLGIRTKESEPCLHAECTCI
jgi:glycosyltransferase involved in cell wall biosynthesis